MTDLIYVGDMLAAQATFINRAGAPADPTTVKLYIEKPDGSIVAYTTGFTAYDGTTREAGSGAYSHDVPIDMSGWWYARWEGTGAVAAAKPDKWHVERDIFEVTP